MKKISKTSKRLGNYRSLKRNKEEKQLEFSSFKYLGQFNIIKKEKKKIPKEKPKIEEEEEIEEDETKLKKIEKLEEPKKEEKEENISFRKRLRFRHPEAKKNIGQRNMRRNSINITFK